MEITIALNSNGLSVSTGLINVSIDLSKSETIYDSINDMISTGAMLIQDEHIAKQLISAQEELREHRDNFNLIVEGFKLYNNMDYSVTIAYNSDAKTIDFKDIRISEFNISIIQVIAFLNKLISLKN